MMEKEHLPVRDEKYEALHAEVDAALDEVKIAQQEFAEFSPDSKGWDSAYERWNAANERYTSAIGQWVSYIAKKKKL